eukprot:COSAG06_NODE_1693_length_8701_cov_80.626133_15_plen_73_part_00
MLYYVVLHCLIRVRGCALPVALLAPQISCSGLWKQGITAAASETVTSQLAVASVTTAMGRRVAQLKRSAQVI